MSTRVFLLAAVSRDGKIAESAEQKSTDWTSKEDLQFFIKMTKQVGVVIMGRKTFETFGKALNGRRLIVMSTRPHEPIDGVEFTTLPPKALIEKLSDEGIAQVIVAGGSQVYSQFLQQGLVHEMYLTYEPVYFPNGIPLAHGINRLRSIKTEMISLSDQTIVVHDYLE